METRTANGDVFDMQREMIDVTRASRPDPQWQVMDAHGHRHQWYTNGEPARRYDPLATYELPTLLTVFDGWRYDEDGERYAMEHYECRACGQRIVPGTTADSETVYIPGLASYRINGESVSPDEFKRRLDEARGGASGPSA